MIVSDFLISPAKIKVPKIGFERDKLMILTPSTEGYLSGFQEVSLNKKNRRT